MRKSLWQQKSLLKSLPFLIPKVSNMSTRSEDVGLTYSGVILAVALK